MPGQLGHHDTHLLTPAGVSKGTAADQWQEDMPGKPSLRSCSSRHGCRGRKEGVRDIFVLWSRLINEIFLFTSKLVLGIQHRKHKGGKYPIF
jgi:hypothetical protein